MLWQCANSNGFVELNCSGFLGQALLTSTLWDGVVNNRERRLEKGELVKKSASVCSPSEICGLEIFVEMIQYILSNL